MPIKLLGSTSGYLILDAPAIANNATLTLPQSANGAFITTGDINTFTRPQIIEVTDNSTAALRITQTGTGEAIRVEDSSNPDSSPFVVNASGEVGIGTTAPFRAIDVVREATGSTLRLTTYADSSAPTVDLRRATGTISDPTAIGSGQAIGYSDYFGYDGSNFVHAARIAAIVDGTPGTNDMPGRLVFYTTADGASSPTERIRIDSAGQVGIGSGTSLGTTLLLNKNITGGTNCFGVLGNGVVQSDATGSATYFRSTASTAAESFTCPSLYHFRSAQGTLGAGSSVTTQIGFFSDASLIGATQNFAFRAENTAAVGSGKTAYGYYTNINTATGGGTTYGFYAAGTATNFFNGNVGIGTSSPNYKLTVNGNLQSTYLNLDNGTSASFVGMGIANRNTSGGVSFIDGQGINGITDSHMFFHHNTNYSSDISFATQPSGTNTDRRLYRLWINSAGHLFPSSDNAANCGLSGNRWSAIWAATGTIQTSDARQKTDIENSVLGLEFINNLRPVSYKWIEGSKHVEANNSVDENGDTVFDTIETIIPGSRTHFGLIAQEVKTALPEDVDFGGWVLTDKDDPESTQALRYDQFIAPLIKAIQELTERVKILESK